MKKIFSIILCLAMMFSLIGCDSGKNDTLPSGSDPATDTDLSDEELEQIIADMEKAE